MTKNSMGVDTEGGQGTNMEVEADAGASEERCLLACSACLLTLSQLALFIVGYALPHQSGGFFSTEVHSFQVTLACDSYKTKQNKKPSQQAEQRDEL